MIDIAQQDFSTRFVGRDIENDLIIEIKWHRPNGYYFVDIEKDRQRLQVIQASGTIEEALRRTNEFLQEEGLGSVGMETDVRRAFFQSILDGRRNKGIIDYTFNGRVYKCYRFTSNERTNEFLKYFSEYGVLETILSEIYCAEISDKGREV